jgi:hypothetical protein
MPIIQGLFSMKQYDLISLEQNNLINQDYNNHSDRHNAISGFLASWLMMLFKNATFSLPYARCLPNGSILLSGGIF